jgi:ABC-type uncharacterized transport system substrate-binding protein
MKRREFILLLGGAPARPIVARRHQVGLRRIGVLMAGVADDRESQARLTAFTQSLQQLGWKASLGVDLRPVEVQGAHEIESAITAFAQNPNGGMIVTGSPAASVHRALIIALAARHRLPTVYNASFYVTNGGLISYGPDFVDQFRRAADYVSRIMNGEKPADLPVQAPTRYETVINLKTAKDLDLALPRMLLARVDKVIG